MAFTQAHLDAINEAIAAGTLEVQYTDRRVKYHSLSEMLRIRSLILQELGTNKAAGSSAHYPTTGKGFH